MAKHLTHEQWKFWIEKYQSCKSKIEVNIFWIEFCKIRNTKLTKEVIKNFKNKIKMYNLNMNLCSKTGKSLKKKIKVSEERKIKLNIKYDELNNYSKEFVIEILKIFTESTNNEIDLDEAISKIKKLNSYVSLNKILYLLGISRTSYFRWKKQINLPKPEA
ncbi:hypothetical protein ACR82Z_01825 [Mycoplasma sp. 6243]|uniref:hypothetical protein n=1 Tax=Mycoplasma sp. 6243 TaxID=3440865 RepID=UPI003EBB6E3E